MKYIKVESLEHLKQLSLSRGDDFVDFVLLIGGGIARSSKRITYYEDMDKFYIINEIDESFKKVLSKDLDSKTNIMAGINSGSFSRRSLNWLFRRSEKTFKDNTFQDFSYGRNH